MLRDVNTVYIFLSRYIGIFTGMTLSARGDCHSRLCGNPGSRLFSGDHRLSGYFMSKIKPGRRY